MVTGSYREVHLALVGELLGINLENTTTVGNIEINIDTLPDKCRGC